MIENLENYIIVLRRNNSVSIQKEDIEQYLFEVKEAVRNDRYRIDRNKKRMDNVQLFTDYVINEDKAKDIVLGLNVMDFSGILQNEHAGYEHEQLYVFGKEVRLLERYGTKIKNVCLYIKFNKLKNRFVIIISFHEQKYPLTYYFR